MKKQDDLQSSYFNKSKLKAFFVTNSTILFTVVVVGLVLWVFIPQLSNLKESISAAKEANKTLLAVALFVFACGFPILALKYYVIAPQKIFYWLTLQVETASAFISKLLPMSIGSLTVNTYYLTKAMGSVTKAGSTMALNATTSSIAFAIFLTFAIVTNHGAINHVSHSVNNIPWTLVAFIILIVGLICWYLIHSKKFISKIKNGAGEMWSNFKKYKNTPFKVLGGIVFNGLGTLTGITTLVLCCRAINLPVTFSEAIMVYTMGNIVGSLVPTPGGLGGAEAGLYGGLVFFGFNADTSLIAVLIYRLITYWLPIIPGYIMYHHLRETMLADFHIKSKPNTKVATQ